MGSLSNRIMNMKFMQSDDSGRNETDENSTKKIKDDSEWVSPYYQEYLTKVKPKNVEYIGYANINDLQSKESQNTDTLNRGSGNPGRKVWGDNTDNEKATLDISRLKDTISKDNKVSIYSFYK
ncbi:Piso0_005260 [Millerozyma farinosa CBS 7064]|uniref:Piso0_005260 protein n=1 Tax=Pichia sorbitophila (strain ATCC MYA-4447 / BCRC 22081 / CBS 7064 / NBRC 10061 / NRRL Y-12695) TaxID=559304 RepID=G8Y4M4_PICSO|nr:Piso0_005260 [Millerozyma farinosa CBS 7064]